MPFPLFMILAGLFGAAGVAASAYAAHGGAGALDARNLAQLETASTFAMLHAAALMGVCALGARTGNSRILALAGILFSTGLALFCGGVALSAFGITDAAPTAPFGGMSFILGWLAVCLKGLTALRQNTSENR